MEDLVWDDAVFINQDEVQKSMKEDREDDVFLDQDELQESAKEIALKHNVFIDQDEVQKSVEGVALADDVSLDQDELKPLKEVEAWATSTPVSSQRRDADPNSPQKRGSPLGEGKHQIKPTCVIKSLCTAAISPTLALPKQSIAKLSKGHANAKEEWNQRNMNEILWKAGLWPTPPAKQGFLSSKSASSLQVLGGR